MVPVPADLSNFGQNQDLTPLADARAGSKTPAREVASPRFREVK
jgi:hypothetical protein